MIEQQWPDRTRRAWDALQLHYQAIGVDCMGHWVAVRLSDGGSDGHLYRSKADATRHQLHERQCAYICLGPDMKIGELHRYLELNEQVYDAGGRLADEGTHVVPSMMDGPPILHLPPGRAHPRQR